MKRFIVAGGIIGLSVLVLGWDVTSAARVNTHLARTAAALHNAPLSGPPRTLLQSVNDAASLRHALLIRQQMLQNPTTRSITAPTWTALGPSDVGGRVNAILTNPADVSQIFVGTAGGGIWQSMDGAKSWSSVGDFLGSLAVSALARVPKGSVTCATTDLLLAGTGDQFNTPRRGLGILSSSDGGVTWTPLATTDPSTNQDWYYVSSIAVNPNGVILVATGVAPTSLSWGDLYKSADCGATFTLVSGGVSEDVAFDPNNANDAIAEDEDGTVRYSTDAGSTWSTPVTIASGGGRATLAYAQANSGWVYASVDDAVTAAASGGPSGSLYLSQDGGHTWTLQGAPTGGLLCSGSECQGNYDNVLWVDPLNSSIVVAGGINLFESSNGGSSWSQISDWTNTPTSPHADHHALAADAGFNGTTDTTFFDGDDGGFYSTGNIFSVTSSGGWTEHNSGLAVTQFYGVSGYSGDVAKLNGNVVPVIGGTQDNGTQLYDMNSGNPAAWTTIFGGDGGITDIDPLDADYLYGEYTYLSLFESMQGGLNTNNFSTLPPDSGQASKAAFIAPMLLDPKNDAAMFAGGTSLWYASNVKGNSTPTWQALNGTTLPATSIVTAIAVDPLDDNDVWVGQTSGLYHSTNTLSGSPSWTQSGAATLPTATAELTSIYLDPSDPTRLYASFFSRTGGTLWESKDSGSTWTDISTGLPQVPVNDVTTDSRSHMLIAATELGLFESADDGTTWSTNAGGPANVEIMKMTWFDPCGGQLLAASYGRGMFLGQVPDAGGVSASTPQAANMAPSSVQVGATDTTLVVTGSNFTACSTVAWNGTALTTRYISPGELAATVPAADLAVSGYTSVTVNSSASGGGTSSALQFSVTSPAPSLNSISPTSATAGSAPFTLKVAGTNLQPSSQVTWNGAALTTTYVSTGEVDANVTTANLAHAGNVSVAVNTPLPGGGTSGSATFTVMPAPTSGGGGTDGLVVPAALLLALGRRRKGSPASR